MRSKAQLRAIFAKLRAGLDPTGSQRRKGVRKGVSAWRQKYGSSQLRRDRYHGKQPWK